MKRKLRTAFRAVQVLFRNGPKPFFILVLSRLTAEKQDGSKLSLVKNDDVLAVGRLNPRNFESEYQHSSKNFYHLAWVMSPPGETSGGHQNIFRFLKFAEEAGHKCTVYLYSNLTEVINVTEIRDMMTNSNAFPNIDAEIRVYDPVNGVAESVDAIFSTGWETAYPSYLDKSNARRLYFVQDYEPYFYPSGTESVLAEATYRFGFRAITAGGWLSHKLKSDFGMWTSHFDFGVEAERYPRVNNERRDEIFFYARPVTPRRGFELGLMTLQEFARLRPEVAINFAGWDVSDWDIPFAFNNLGGLDISQLNDVYNKCAAALVISMTNMSLLPLELISAGVAPVVNSGSNNEMVSSNPFIQYRSANPSVLAQALVDVVDSPDQILNSQSMSHSVKNHSWDVSAQQFLTCLNRAMNE